MSVAKKRPQGPPTIDSAYTEWRFGLDYRTCPSLQEAFAAGVEAADRIHQPAQTVVTVVRPATGPASTPLVAVRQAPATPDEAQDILWDLGIDAGLLSPQEAQALSLIAESPRGRAFIGTVGRIVCPSTVNSVHYTRCLVSRARTKLRRVKSPVCVAALGQGWYRVHRADDGDPCPSRTPTGWKGADPLCWAGAKRRP